MNTAEPAPTSDGGGGAAAAAAAAATAAASSNPSAIVPQLAEHGITEEDLATAIRVLDAISSLDPKRRRKKRKNGNESKKRKGAPSEKDGDGQSDGDCNNEVNNNKKEGAEEGGGSEDGLSLYRKPNLRPFRKALSQTLSLHKMTMYEGQSEEQYYEKRIAERTLKRQKMSERAMQRKYVANTDLRRGRVEKLERLRQEEGRDEEEGKVKLLEYLIPDGHVDTATATIGNEDGGVKMLENGNAPEPGAKQSSNGDGATESAGGGEEPTILPKQRSCYSCKVRFRVLHHFYDQLCPTCAPLNFDKRHQSIDMSGKVAVVTGSRVKIGFQVCLKLLRAGCEVVATTRFPNNAVAAYRKEKDFGVWKGRLHVYALDLRDVTGLEAFTRYLKGLYGERGVDVLINNACQTVRRPGGYYVPLVEGERDLWSSADDDHRDVLGGCREFERVRRRLVDEQQRQSSDGGAGRGNGMLPAGPTVGKEKLLLDAPGAAQTENDGQKSADSQIVTATDNQSAVPFESTGISHSAAMSQMPILPEDVGIDPEIMPPNLSDINGHQLDLRTHNSWLLKMDEVSTPEVMECMFVNAIAPFVLNSRLKPLMEAHSPPHSADAMRPDRYIVNVSAMEGKFYRYKMPNHPHTNMAKAALNMLTRTSAEDLAKKSRIYMNSVDTGWINDENPLERASKTAKANLFQTPIDEVDAAARILDPVFSASKEYGKFWKDYKESEW